MTGDGGIAELDDIQSGALTSASRTSAAYLLLRIDECGGRELVGGCTAVDAGDHHDRPATRVTRA